MNTMLERILIVDDEPDMCWVLEHILEKCGRRSAKAFSGKEALACLANGGFRLVFLDAKLPDLDGLEVARRMHKMEPLLPIVMVSGYFYRNDESVQRALAEGLLSGFVAKPFLHEEILKAVEIGFAGPVGKSFHGSDGKIP